MASPIGFEMSIGGSSAGLTGSSCSLLDGLDTVFSCHALRCHHAQQRPYLACEIASQNAVTQERRAVTKSLSAKRSTPSRLV